MNPAAGQEQPDDEARDQAADMRRHVDARAGHAEEEVVADERHRSRAHRLEDRGGHFAMADDQVAEQGADDAEDRTGGPRADERGWTRRLAIPPPIPDRK